MQRFVRGFLRTNAYREEKKSSRERNGWGGGLCNHVSQQSNNPQEARQFSRIKYLVLVPTLGV